MLAGPTITFHADAVLSLCGAEFEAKVDDQPLPFWTAVAVKAGSTVTIGNVRTLLAAPTKAAMHT